MDDKEQDVIEQDVKVLGVKEQDYYEQEEDGDGNKNKPPGKILNIEVYDQDPPGDTEPQGGRDVACTIYAPEKDLDKENQTQDQEPPAKLQVNKAKKRKVTKKKSKHAVIKFVHSQKRQPQTMTGRNYRSV